MTKQFNKLTNQEQKRKIFNLIVRMSSDLKAPSKAHRGSRQVKHG